MKKIITAIHNPKINEELKKENSFEIIGKDLQYKEAIIELLEKNKKIDLIIISENLLGDISFENLFEKINLINEKIKIIFILEKENEELKKILLKNNINEIYYKNKINLIKLIKIINKKENNSKEKKLKRNKKVSTINYFEEKNVTTKSKQKINKQNKTVNKTNIMSNKFITFSGNPKSGKTTLALIISQYLSNKNYRVLLIDGDFEKHDLSTILKNDLKEENAIKNFLRKDLQKKETKKLKIKYNNFKNKNKSEKNKVKKLNTNLKNKIKNTKLKIKNKNKINKLEIKDNKNKKIKIYNFKNLEIKKFNSKNKIYILKIKNKINMFTKKINNNFYFFSKLNQLLKNYNEKNQKMKINIFLQLIKGKYDFIIFDLSKYNFGSINKEILKKASKNFILTEANLLGMKEIQNLLKLYINKWRINKNSLHIIENRYRMDYISVDLLSKIFLTKDKLFVIKENKKYIFFIDNFLKRNILLKNKKIKNDLNKIIKIIF